MAQILANAAPLKPEVKLAQALDDYGKILSDEERRQLYDQGPPDAMAAINFTTLLDRDRSNRSRQCMGPRLITFLESVQHFSGVADTFVSSHPELAALVWGGVKVALLARYIPAKGYRKHCVTTILPSYGFVSTQRDVFGSQVFKCFLDLSRLPKELLVSFKAEFGPYQNEIERFSKEVQDEADLASKQAQKQENELQAIERSEAKKLRQSWTNFTKGYQITQAEETNRRLETNRRKLEKNRIEALDALSTYDHQKTYKQIRKECVPGTSMWICENPAFDAWLSETLKTLWLIGRLGSGKSVTSLSACIIAYLIKKNVSSKDVTAFFFCRFDDQESLKARTIIGSVAKQLVNYLPADTFRQFDHRNIDGVAIIEFLEATLDHSRWYFIVLDGLDECEEAQLKEAAEIFHNLLLLPRLHIKFFWSSRPNVQNWLPGRFLTKQHIDLGTVENQDKITCDIRTFIHITLEEWLDGDTPELQINDPTLIITITDRLEREAQGMFLWVKFQLDTLRQKRSDKLILAALNDLPRDLPETFRRILSRYTEADDIDVGRRIFHWVAIAKRPLTVEELREAIGTKPLQETWSDDSYINDMKKAIACCGNLVFIEEEQQTVHFTHGSVKQYLLSDAVQESLTKHFVDLRKADEDAGAVCITYLNFPVFNRQVARKVDDSIRTTDITTTVVKNSLPLGQTANKIALAYLERRNKTDKSIHHLLQDATGDIDVNRQQKTLKDYAFLQYAKQFWLEHTKQEIDHNSTKLWRLWRNLIVEARGRDTLSSAPWTLEDWESHAANVLEWVVEQNHCSLARLIISSDIELAQQKLLILVKGAALRGHARLIEISLGSEKVSQNVLDLGLQAAAGGGHVEVVKRLLQANADVNADARDRDKTALQAAAGGGHIEVVERLLQEKAKVNTAPGFGSRTALQVAAEGGYLDVVECLLQANADVNADARDSDKTALQAAAGGGYIEVVERLLQEKAEVNAASGFGSRTALQAAAAGGHIEVVKRLLQEKAKVNAAPGFGSRTALQAAAKGGYLDVVESLLQANADVNTAPGYNGKTVLQAAAEGGHLDVVERLLQAKAEVNATASNRYNGRTALQAAAEGGYLDVVESLLQANADVNAAPGYNGKTTLQAAAEGGHLEVVERLLQAKAEVNAAPAGRGIGRTALQAAAENGHVEVVERLLQAKAKVNAAPASEGGSTALQAAAAGGYIEVVERLLQAKAEVNAAPARITGSTALQAAAGGGHLDVVERLRIAGAK
ncbi:MAG: hypothetical protein Q9181_004084 [Wetmoreana brouardii]